MTDDGDGTEYVFPEDELVKVKEDLHDTAQYAYQLMAERDRQRIRIGELEGVIEGAKALLESADAHLYDRVDPTALRTVLTSLDNHEFYDQSWRVPWWHEQLADEGHLCGRDHHDECEGCLWLEEEDYAEDEMHAV